MWHCWQLDDHGMVEQEDGLTLEPGFTLEPGAAGQGLRSSPWVTAKEIAPVSESSSADAGIHAASRSPAGAPDCRNL